MLTAAPEMPRSLPVEKFAADRMTPLLERLGNPQKRLPVVHVGGTNGKGSICAMLAAIAHSAGIKVGRLTSPHLVKLTERISFKGEDISQPELERQLVQVRQASQNLSADGVVGLSNFDLLTAAALRYFDSRQADLAVVEVGLGGKGDATNVFPAPLLSIISNVSLDHLEELGCDEEAIAAQKAGIIKLHRPVLTQATGRAYRVIAAIAKDRRSKLKEVAPASFVSTSGSGQRIGYRGRLWELGLQGTYQLHNVSLAIEAVDILRAEGFDIPDEAICRGLANVTWPGRFELVRDRSGRSWCFDGAHNLPGIQELILSLRRHVEREDLVLVFGVLLGKPGPGMLQALAPLAKTIFLTSPPSSKAFPPHLLASGLNHPDLRIVSDPAVAFEEVQQTASGSLTVVCGSLYLVGLLRSLLATRFA